ncbi:hypothetical protein JoomaDRAFT_0413 [Galbibacter orientalis DSM 19592]|uniref:Uncharacterized protein n=1 Tax=Galbibacter orientalis DSM 19592 TaxID=926559 RepID=I3C1H5_9FLAO|nr:hypothetical protein [Galbibacter orientalis]EIJ37468.1 hypothetical protein JoomaDRAFT_0413 [Galbibacter orientalis DSM 19592]
MNSHDASDIHVYLVPIAGEEEMEGEINTNTPLPQYGKDILKLGDEAELELASAIYNFSTPCPQQCDEGGELYSENNID